MIRLVCILSVAASGCVTLPRPSDRNAVADTPATRGHVKWLVEHIDDNPDILHGDYTPAADELVELGSTAILPTLDLMMSDNLLTRLRAENVLAGITKKQFGLCETRGERRHERQEAWEKFWADLGGLDANTSAEQREASIKLWKEHFAYLAKP